MQHILRLCLAVYLAVTAMAVAAETISLTLPEARSLAAKMITAGRPAEALRIVDGVLLGRPEDAAALILRARALRDLGRPDEAQKAAAKARKAAATREDQFFAMLVTAQAQASAGRRGLAQISLRRAAQKAPDDVTRALAVRDFLQVRSRTPWRVELDFHAEQSDNLNNAPPDNTVEFFSLPFKKVDAVPLTGLRYGASGQFRYTLMAGKNARVHTDLIAGFSRVRLSDKSRQFEWADAEDYSTQTLGFGLRYETATSSRDAITEFGLSGARQWSAGDLNADTLRVTANHRRALAPMLTGTARLSYAVTRRRAVEGRDMRSRAVGFGLHRSFNHGTLSLDVSASQIHAEEDIDAKKSRGIGLSYRLAKPVAGMLPTISTNYQRIDYASRPVEYFDGPNQTASEWRLSVDVLLPDLNYFGFAPTVGVSFTDRNSNYSLYDSTRTDLRLGLKSVF